MSKGTTSSGSPKPLSKVLDGAISKPSQSDSSRSRSIARATASHIVDLTEDPDNDTESVYRVSIDRIVDSHSVEEHFIGYFRSVQDANEAAELAMEENYRDECDEDFTKHEDRHGRVTFTGYVVDDDETVKTRIRKERWQLGPWFKQPLQCPEPLTYVYSILVVERRDAWGSGWDYDHSEGDGTIRTCRVHGVNKTLKGANQVARDLEEKVGRDCGGFFGREEHTNNDGTLELTLEYGNQGEQMNIIVGKEVLL
ncbi:hypothetical protein MMC24_003086 [Lignoscripta atroalba]|nr:hypothetical protein [Lignoscripta atroalba]